MHRMKCAQLEKQLTKRTGETRMVKKTEANGNKTNSTAESHSRRLHRTWKYNTLVTNWPENIESLLFIKRHTHRERERKKRTALVCCNGIVCCRPSHQPATAFISHLFAYGIAALPQYYGHYSEIVCNCSVAFSFYIFLMPFRMGRTNINHSHRSRADGETERKRWRNKNTPL